MSIFPIADPYILREGDVYYLYAAGPETGMFTVRTSADMENWSAAKEIFRAAPDAWSIDCYWAPECHRIGDRFFLFFSANLRYNPTGALETFRIGAAVCDTPDGCFTDLLNRPIFDPGYPIIDANILCENGHVYLYYSRCCYEHTVDNQYEESWVYGVELKPDLSGAVSEPVLLLRPEQEWENRSAPSTNRRWNEGSCIIKHDGRYYMMFSANYYRERHYAMGYAVSSSPLGPFVKAEENPIVECTAAITGPGHGCLVDTPHGMRAVYHGYTEETGDDRVGFFAPAVIKNGKLHVDYLNARPMRSGCTEI